VRDVNFVCADEVLSQQFHHFMKFEFSESVSEAVSTTSRQDKQALNTYEDSARLVDGHYQIAIPWKCHSPDLPNNEPKEFATIADVQIHHFSDASEVDYGAVSYLRFIDTDSRVHCSFVMSKTRLDPLKSLSVPRLELTAATLAVKLKKMLRKELEVPINRSVFWTDSTSVLRYIENKDKRFHTFVSNRLTMIHDGSTPDQWRYVDSTRNPSNAASRGLSAKALLESDSWRSGPEFLWQDESSWQTPPTRQENISDDDPEIKREVRVHTVELDKSMETVEKLLCSFSSWDKLRKSVVYILRFKEQGALQVRPNQESVFANKWKSYC